MPLINLNTVRGQWTYFLDGNPQAQLQALFALLIALYVGVKVVDTFTVQTTIDGQARAMIQGVNETQTAISNDIWKNITNIGRTVTNVSDSHMAHKLQYQQDQEAMRSGLLQLNEWRTRLAADHDKLLLDFSKLVKDMNARAWGGMIVVGLCVALFAYIWLTTTNKLHRHVESEEEKWMAKARIILPSWIVEPHNPGLMASVIGEHSEMHLLQQLDDKEGEFHQRIDAILTRGTKGILRKLRTADKNVEALRTDVDAQTTVVTELKNDFDIEKSTRTDLATSLTGKNDELASRLNTLGEALLSQDDVKKLFQDLWEEKEQEKLKDTASENGEDKVEDLQSQCDELRAELEGLKTSKPSSKVFEKFKNYYWEKFDQLKTQCDTHRVHLGVHDEKLDQSDSVVLSAAMTKMESEFESLMKSFDGIRSSIAAIQEKNERKDPHESSEMETMKKSVAEAQGFAQEALRKAESAAEFKSRAETILKKVDVAIASQTMAQSALGTAESAAASASRMEEKLGTLAELKEEVEKLGESVTKASGTLREHGEAIENLRTESEKTINSAAKSREELSSLQTKIEESVRSSADVSTGLKELKATVNGVDIGSFTKTDDIDAKIQALLEGLLNQRGLSDAEVENVNDCLLDLNERLKRLEDDNETDQGFNDDSEDESSGDSDEDDEDDDDEGGDEPDASATGIASSGEHMSTDTTSPAPQQQESSISASQISPTQPSSGLFSSFSPAAGNFSFSSSYRQPSSAPPQAPSLPQGRLAGSPGRVFKFEIPALTSPNATGIASAVPATSIDTPKANAVSSGVESSKSPVEQIAPAEPQNDEGILESDGANEAESAGSDPVAFAMTEAESNLALQPGSEKPSEESRHANLAAAPVSSVPLPGEKIIGSTSAPTNATSLSPTARGSEPAKANALLEPRQSTGSWADDMELDDEVKKLAAIAEEDSRIAEEEEVQSALAEFELELEKMQAVPAEQKNGQAAPTDAEHTQRQEDDVAENQKEFPKQDESGYCLRGGKMECGIEDCPNRHRNALCTAVKYGAVCSNAECTFIHNKALVSRRPVALRPTAAPSKGKNTAGTSTQSGIPDRDEVGYCTAGGDGECKLQAEGKCPHFHRRLPCKQGKRCTNKKCSWRHPKGSVVRDSPAASTQATEDVTSSTQPPGFPEANEYGYCTHGGECRLQREGCNNKHSRKDCLSAKDCRNLKCSFDHKDGHMARDSLASASAKPVTAHRASASSNAGKAAGPLELKPFCTNGGDCTVSGCPFRHSQTPCRDNECKNSKCTYYHSKERSLPRLRRSVTPAPSVSTPVPAPTPAPPSPASKLPSREPSLTRTPSPAKLPSSQEKASLAQTPVATENPGSQLNSKASFGMGSSKYADEHPSTPKSAGNSGKGSYKGKLRGSRSRK